MRLDKDKLLTMLEMQAGMNAKVNPKWLTAHYPFLRAVMMEGAEAMEHVGWKWWKKQTNDVEQLQMELVDIWHFAMSDALVQAGGEADTASGWLTASIDNPDRDRITYDNHSYCLLDMDILSRLELLIGMAVFRRFDIALFETLLKDVSMTWDDLYIAYVGKNVLNFFRQDHGYKVGTYQKIWQGREDNEHLTKIMLTLDPSAPDFCALVYSRLDTCYRELTGVGVPQ